MVSGQADDAALAGRAEFVVVAGVAVILMALAAWRCTFSIGLTDDALYVALPLRLAEGGRIFANEMSLQALGYWVAVPFAMAWKAAFGMTGIVLAVRLAYVVVGGLAAVVVYRALRPDFSPAACALAVAVPVLAAPYNILGIDYNTSAGLSFMLAAGLLFAAQRRRSVGLAVAGGLAVGFGILSYPPLAVAGLVLLGTYAWVGRDAKSAAIAVAAAAGLLAVAGLALLALSSIPDVVRTLAYASGTVAMARTPAYKASYSAWWALHSTLLDPYLAPLWALAVVASIRRLPSWLRTTALMLLPVVAALPGVARIASRQDPHWFAALAAGYLVIFLIAATLPVTVDAITHARADTLRLLALTAPFTVAALAMVSYSTSAAWWRATPVIAMTAIALPVVAGWSEAVRRGAGSAGLAIAAALLLLGVVGFLFGMSADDQPPWALRTVVTSGSYAGIATSPGRAAQMRDFESAVRAWVRPAAGILAVQAPIVYLLADRPVATNVMFLIPGSTDSATVEYYERTGGVPAAVFIGKEFLTPGRERSDIPLVAYLREHYRMVASTAGTFAVWDRIR